jgi:hypothetical protein
MPQSSLEKGEKRESEKAHVELSHNSGPKGHRQDNRIEFILYDIMQGYFHGAADQD